MTLFNALFITALGMILYINGILIATSTSEEPLPTAFHDSVHIEFAGAMLATIFWVITCMFLIGRQSAVHLIDPCL